MQDQPLYLVANRCSIPNVAKPLRVLDPQRILGEGRLPGPNGLATQLVRMSEAKETTPNETRSVARCRIEIKVSLAQKDLISRGAAASGQGLSEFVRSTAERAAAEIVNRR